MYEYGNDEIEANDIDGRGNARDMNEDIGSELDSVGAGRQVVIIASEVELENDSEDVEPVSVKEENESGCTGRGRGGRFRQQIRRRRRSCSG